MRKESGFSVTDRIQLKVFGDSDLQSAFTLFRDFITGETLASDSEWAECSDSIKVEAEDKVWKVKINKL